MMTLIESSAICYIKKKSIVVNGAIRRPCAFRLVGFEKLIMLVIDFGGFAHFPANRIIASFRLVNNFFTQVGIQLRKVVKNRVQRVVCPDRALSDNKSLPAPTQLDTTRHPDDDKVSKDRFHHLKEVYLV